jgi:hypothetical protein
MPSTDPRGSHLRAYASLARELLDHCEARIEAGRSVADRDVQRLGALAERLGREATAWSGAVRALEAVAVRPLDPHRAARLVIESVFDETLIPEATRVLAAALDLACPAT